MSTRRLLLSPLLLLVALATVLGAGTGSATAAHRSETRVRALPAAAVDAVGHGSGETAGSVGQLRPSPPGLASGSCVATEAGPLALEAGPRPMGEIGPAGNPGARPGVGVADHHIFPQQFREPFEGAGINIDDYTVTLDQTTHLRGVHGGGLPNSGMPGGWNGQWAEFLNANPGASAQQIYQQAGQMMDDFGLSGRTIHPYRK